MIYLNLFLSFFQIGLFSIGGGYAAMPLIQHQVTEVHPWLTMTQFSDIIVTVQTRLNCYRIRPIKSLRDGPDACLHYIFSRTAQ